MTDADRTAFENLLTDAVDGLVTRVEALLTTDPERAEKVAALRSALSNLIEQTLSRASGQAASASLLLNDINRAAVAALEARVEALERRVGIGGQDAVAD